MGTRPSRIARAAEERQTRLRIRYPAPAKPAVQQAGQLNAVFRSVATDTPIARARSHVRLAWPQRLAAAASSILQWSYRRCPDDPPGMILVVAPDTMLTMDAMVACSAATCDASRPPYSRSCTAPCSTGLSLYKRSLSVNDGHSSRSLTCVTARWRAARQCFPSSRCSRTRIDLAVPGRPICPWSRRTGTSEASATDRNGASGTT
jgi:hypothetical protein